MSCKCWTCGGRIGDAAKGEEAEVIYRPRCTCALRVCLQCGRKEFAAPPRDRALAWLCVACMSREKHPESVNCPRCHADGFAQCECEPEPERVDHEPSAALRPLEKACQACHPGLDGAAMCICDELPPSAPLAVEGLDLLRIAGPGRAVVVDAEGRCEVIDDPSPHHPIVHGLICSDACADAVLAILTAMNAGRCTFPELAEQVLAARAKAGGR